MLIEIAGRWIRRFTQIQEVAGAEEGLVTSKHRFGEGASLIDPSLNELLEPNKRVCGDGFACSDIDETPQQSPRVFGRIPESGIEVEIVEQGLMRGGRPRLGG